AIHNGHCAIRDDRSTHSYPSCAHSDFLAANSGVVRENRQRNNCGRRAQTHRSTKALSRRSSTEGQPAALRRVVVELTTREPDHSSGALDRATGTIARRAINKASCIWSHASTCPVADQV